MAFSIKLDNLLNKGSSIVSSVSSFASAWDDIRNSDLSSISSYYDSVSSYGTSSSSSKSDRNSEPALSENGIWSKNAVSQSIIRVETVNTICAIPPVPDNIVDPPAFYDISCFENGRVTLKSWDTTVNKSGPYIGRDYFDRVMARGSMLFLLPLELTTPVSKISANAIVGDGSGESNFAFGSAHYGFEVKFQTRRYTETVLMHFFMAAAAIGLDFTQTKTLQKAKKCLPDCIYKTITGNTIDEQTFTNEFLNQMGTGWETAKKVGAAGVAGALVGGLASGGAAALITGLTSAAAAYGKLSVDSKSAQVENDAANAVTQFDLLQEQISEKQAEYDTLDSSSSEAKSLLKEINNLKDSQKSLVTSGNLISSCYPGISDSSKQTAIDSIMKSAEQTSIGTAISNFINGSLYAQQRAEQDILLHYVGGFTPSLMQTFGLTTKSNLNYTVFNLNGPPTRDMSFSNDTQESAIARLVGRISVEKGADAAKDIASNAVNLVKNIPFVGSAVEGVDLNGIIDEMYTHNSNIGAEYIIGLAGMYDRMTIPRVYNSSTFSPSYRVDIREVCISTDKYSLLRIFWTISHLLPYAVPMQSPGIGMLRTSPAVTPRAPMYCMAYVKGVMNLPRCLISNLSLQFDPKFQTIEGVPTEVTISMDMSSFLSIATTPLLGSLWTASYSGDGEYSDGNWTIITQMFNPTSTINIIATLCGFNTIFVQPSKGLAYYGVQLLFGKLIRARRNFKNMMANVKKGYIGSVANDRIFGLDSNIKIGILTGS